jgi:transposase
MTRDLEQENARLRADNAALRAELAKVRAELAKVRAQLDELLTLAATQNEQLSDITAMLRRKMTQRKAGATDKPAAADSEGDTAGNTPPKPKVPAGRADAAGTPDPAPPPPPDKRPRKPRPKGAGRKPPPPHLPKVFYEGKVCQCKHCGSTNLLSRDKQVSDRLDAVEIIARLRREVLHVSRCKDCGETTTAQPPSLPCPRSKFTCGFLAWLVTMKFVMLVPVHRIWRLLKRQGTPVPKSTLVRLIDLAATLASTVDGAHWTELKTRSCIRTDATGLKVLMGLPEAWDGVLDVFNVDETTVYQFALTKHGDDLAAMLKGFEGTILCDAESRLNELCSQEGVKRANCNAHPRRAFRDAEASQPVLARQAGNFLSRMYAVERRASDEGLSGSALLERRQRETRPIVDAFKVWLEAQANLLPSDPLGQVVRYYLRHFDGLTRFVDDPNIPIDNNASERAFQDHARLRLNALFAGSAEGARNWAILLGIVTTAQRHDLDVQAYLTWMFERRGTRKREYGLSAAQLTPAAYKEMLEQERRRAAGVASMAAAA